MMILDSVLVFRPPCSSLYLAGTTECRPYKTPLPYRTEVVIVTVNH